MALEATSAAESTNLSDGSNPDVRAPSGRGDVGRDGALETINKFIGGEKSAKKPAKPKTARKPKAKAAALQADESPVEQPAKRPRRSEPQPEPNYTPPAREYGFDDEDRIIPNAENGDTDDEELEGGGDHYEGLTGETDHDEQGAQRDEGESWPSWLEDAIGEYGMAKGDFSSPRAAHKYLQMLSRGGQPVAGGGQQAESQQGDSKAFDPFEGFDRAELNEALGESVAGKIVGLVEKIHKHYAEQFGAVERFAGEMYSHMSESRADKIDSFFESLNADSEFRGAFGDGTLHDLEAGGIESTNRMKAWEALRELMQIRKAPLTKATLKRAALIAGVKPGKRQPPPAPQSNAEADEELQAKLKQRAKHRLGAGSPSNGHATLSGQASAIRTISRFMR